MEKFFKWLLISIYILLSLPIILVIFIIVGMGFVAVQEELINKNHTDHNITQHVYSDGRKTLHSFGNKRFAIEKGVWYGEKTKCLFDREKNGVEGTIDYIKNYKQSYNFIYALGEKGYTKLNYETGEFTQSKNIDDFSNEDKAVFNKLESIKSEAKDDQEKHRVSWEWIIS